MVSEDAPWFQAYARFARALTHGLLAVSGMSLLAMTLLVTADVILRKCLNAPIKGSLDLVSLLGAISIAAALPYTTAVKGHVAIEFFFQALPQKGRVIVDTLARIIVLVLFAFLTWRFILYGFKFMADGEVTPTLQIPLFWVPWLFSFSSACVVLVKIYHLMRPGQTMIKP